jgi:hypothetical protein
MSACVSGRASSARNNLALAALKLAPHETRAILKLKAAAAQMQQQPIGKK